MSSETTTFGTPGMARVRDEILSAGRTLWLAGLGAVMEIEEGSRKVLRRFEAEGRKTFDRLQADSRKTFDELVERGRPLAERQKQTVQETGDRVGGAVRDAAEKAGETVREAGKLLGDTAEYEVKGLLRKMGLMTYDDVQALAARLEALSRKLDEIAAAGAAPAVTADEAEAPRPARRPRTTAAKAVEN
jgi:polyhydroxyalkanoate synthesis regulator phasin